MPYDEPVDAPAGTTGPPDPEGADASGAGPAAPRGRARSMADGTKRAANATGRGARRVGSATARGAGFTFRQARRATQAEGAGDTGLYRMIELHAFNAAGDAAVAISLAGTLFFQVPTAQARGQVAEFLALTMLPFAVVAPLIGPFLDRFSRGRRWAMGATMALRGFLCWVLAGSVAHGSLAIFPAALGCLVASKAYGVTRAAAVPRLLPDQLSLVKANSRISLAGVAGAAISAPIAVGLSRIGPSWSLRYGFLVFVGGTILAILLPQRVDTVADPEARVRDSKRPPLPRSVVTGLRANSGLRLLSGFLTLYMAFLLRAKPLPGWEHKQAALLALVVGAAGVGSTIGIGLGSVVRRVRPEISVVICLMCDVAVIVLAAVLYGLPTLVLLGFVAGLAQSFGKLSLDSLIQRDVPDDTRAGAFARSETLLQLSWVVGGFIGIALPLLPQVGLGVAAGLLVGWGVWLLLGLRPSRAATAP